MRDPASELPDGAESTEEPFARTLSRGPRLDLGADTRTLAFIRGEISALPFPDGAFRTVVWRGGLHRVADPGSVLREIRRVLAPHGWLGLEDLVVSEDAAVAAEENRIERLRDPLHVQALSGSALQDLLVRSGFEVTAALTRGTPPPGGTDGDGGFGHTVTFLLVLNIDV